MQQNEVMKLALKVSGIYVLVQAIQYIPSIVTLLSAGNKAGNTDKTGMLIFFITPISFIIRATMCKRTGHFF